MTEKKFDENERRQAFRIDMENEIIDISWLNDKNEKVTRRIACMDFSRGGLKINCDSVIEENTNVTIVFRAANANSQHLKGHVLRCLKQNNGWFNIGIKLDSTESL